MTGYSFTLFDTAIGRCGIAWGERGIVGLQLPEAREKETRARLLSRIPGASEGLPPPAIQRALDGVAALLSGGKNDLSAVMLDMADVPAFHRRVYEAARAIPPGATLSYGQIAQRIGSPGAARAVGQALGRNPFPIVVPCHRVLAANGKIGGFSANGGIATKLRMLSLERAGSATATPLADADASPAFDAVAAVAHLRQSDAALARVIDAIGPFGLRRKGTQNLFVALAEAIVYQQLHGKAAATIFARLCALFPRAESGPTPRQILRAPEAALRGAGLSAAKLLSLRDLARHTLDGDIPTLDEIGALADDEIIERLSRVRGIGCWTAEMLLIFRLGRPDVLPADDYGIRKGFAIAFKKRTLPAPKDVLARGHAWRPYRTAASWYLWRLAERGSLQP
jgi:methylated-DNA-[protein]-cysteine S-methyltransferase